MEDLPELFETDTDFLNVERIHALENIVRHYAGLDHLTKENLEEFIVSLPIHKDVSSHDQEHPEQKSIAELAVRLLDSPGGQIQLQPSAGESEGHSDLNDRILTDPRGYQEPLPFTFPPAVVQ
ncbi:hypothetical protein ACHAPD_011971 [Fusarium lateritium]